MKKLWIYITFFLFFFAILYFVEDYFVYQNYNIDKVQESFNKKQKDIDKLINKSESFLSKNKILPQNSILKSSEDIVLYIYQKDSLKYWNSNKLNINGDLLNKKDGLIKISSAYCFKKSKKIRDFTIVALVVVKYSYAYENEFLINTFNKDFGISKENKIKTVEIPNNSIYTIDNKFAFAIKQSKNQIDEYDLHIVIFLYLIFLFLFIFVVKISIHKIKIFKNKPNLFIFVFGIFLFGLRFVMLYFQIPSIFNYSAIFSPEYYAYSFWLPSLADMFINTIFISIFVYTIYQNLFISIRTISKFYVFRYLFAFVVFLSIFILFGMLNFLLRNLIFHSSINFELHKILKISIFTVISFIIVALLIFSFAIITRKLIHILTRNFSKIEFYIVFAITLGIGYVGMDYIFPEYNSNIINIFALFLLLLIGFLSISSYSKNKIEISNALIILYAAMFCVSYVNNVSEKKERENRKIIISNIEIDRDIIAEMLFKDITSKIVNNKTLQNLVEQNADEDEVKNFLRTNIFSGYFNKYDININICKPNSTIYVAEQDKTLSCLDVISEKIKKAKERIEKTPFYLTINIDDEFNYFSIFKYQNSSIYIELKPKLLADQLGYPELLINKDVVNNFLSEYSYAKYKNNKLVLQSGKYYYSLKSDVFDNLPSEKFTEINGYSHLVFRPNNSTIIVLSKEKIKIFDIIISFSYIFVIFYLLINLIIVIYKIYKRKTKIEQSLKNRIQAVIITILLVSFILVGGGTIYYNIKQYQITQYQNINEKIKSILTELQHKLGQKTSLEKETPYLNYLLTKLSNIFFTDINVYDTNGQLLSSSRPEIFDKSLLGTQMNAIAFQKMEKENSTNFVNIEKIGNLEYISVYMPFRNRQNKVLAYINLPYFAQQNILQENISALIVAIMNIYILLIIASIISAVLISNRITKPLRIIKEHFKGISLRTAKPIKWKKSDEIGQLIREYNKMVRELSVSADLLAQSEREQAWKEMAKLIAHEIKNPLTPMKLNIQLLQRTYKDKDSNFEERFNKISETLIEQINNLSRIANEFSNFAKIFSPKRENINVVERINTSINLFKEVQNIEIIFNFDKNKEIFVLADKEQLLSVFNNIIKNAIQAVEVKNENNGKIIVDITQNNKLAIISIQDNGTGIANNERKKIFEPNFTTKSSGMGLGLAITRKIVENFDGQIWFETIEDEGTTFFLQFNIIE